MALLKDGTRVYGTFNANTAVLVGNATVNTYLTATTISVANATQNLALTPISVLTGNTSEFFLANTTLLRVVSASSSANLSPVTLTLGTSIVNTSVLAAGANVVANTSALFIGNSTINATTTQALLSISNSTSTANLTAAGVTVGNSVVNTTAIAVGANIVANTTTILVGNSTVNSVVTSSLVQVSNSTSTANLIATGLVVGNSTVNTIVTSSSVTVNNPGASLVSVGNSTVNSTLSATTLTVKDIVATGNLNVNGTITYINTTNLTIGDNIITLNADVGLVAPSENAGIEINRGSSANVFLRWNETSDIWQTTVDGTNYATIATNNDVSTAYSNAIAYSGNAALAYANAIAYSANATNISSGTLDTARLPATANVSTAINVGANVNVSTSTINVGNSTVNSTITSAQLKLGGNVSANGGVGTAGQVLTSGAAGNVYWSTPSGGGASVTISDTAPLSPSAGNLWWDSTVGVMRIYYSDGTSNQWVDASPQGAGGGGSAITTYVLDDISPYFDGTTTSFAMTSNTSAVTPDSPYRLDVRVGGIQIPPAVLLVDYLNAPEAATYSPGYTISGSTISFVSAPRSGMTFYATMQNGDTVSPTFVASKQSAVFNALNIMSGY